MRTVVVEDRDLLDGSLAQYGRTQRPLAQYRRRLVRFVVGRHMEVRHGRDRFVVNVQTQLHEEHLTAANQATYDTIRYEMLL